MPQVLHGEFAFDRSKLPDPLGPPVEAKIPATFTGKLLTGDGFTDDVQTPVTVALNCISAWCASITPDTDYVAFVTQSERELTFNVSPCYQFSFANPTDEMVAKIEQCAAGGDCAPAE